MSRNRMRGLFVAAIGCSALVAALAGGCASEPGAVSSTGKAPGAPQVGASKQAVSAPNPEPGGPGPTEEQAGEKTRSQGVLPPGPAMSEHDARETCAGMCDRTVSLGCGPRQACVENCTQMLADDLCPDRMRAFLTCALAHADKDWECGPDQAATLRDGVCEREQRAFFVCAQQALAREQTMP